MKKIAVFLASGSGMGANAAKHLSSKGFDVAIMSSSGKGEEKESKNEHQSILVHPYAKVHAIMPGSPSSRAGLEIGDVVERQPRVSLTLRHFY